MKIKELAQKIEICTTQDNLRKTAGIMKQNDIDAVPILNEAKEIVGVVTQTGICEVVANSDRKTSSIKNIEIALEEILICDPDEKFDKILKKLSKKRIKFAGFSSQKDNSVAIISLPKILSRFTDDKKLIKRVFRAMEKINKPLPLVLSEVGLTVQEK
jgi:predicted transcriptional regulator